MTDADPPVLQLHDPGDPRFSLRYITDDPSERTEYMIDEADRKVAIAEATIDGRTLYLFYVRPVVEAAFLDFDTEADVIRWVEDTFSDSDFEIVVAVMNIFDGILTEKEAQDGTFSIYKRMDFEKIPEALNRVQWRQAVPTVGAELLSQFILAHPMPNTNHRTAIGLLDRYLTSYEAGFAIPDTGEDGRWFDWARDYIYDSKRLLTLRNKYRLLYWARHYGFEMVERKEGIQIDLTTLDLERDDFRAQYTDQHLARSCTFVDTVLEEAGATHLREKMDDGKRAFADRLRGSRD